MPNAPKFTLLLQVSISVPALAVTLLLLINTSSNDVQPSAVEVTVQRKVLIPGSKLFTLVLYCAEFTNTAAPVLVHAPVPNPDTSFPANGK